MSITYSGSIDDIRCSLRNLNPKTDAQRHEYIDYLSMSYKTEANKIIPRATVLKMINVKIKQLSKLSL